MKKRVSLRSNFILSSSYSQDSSQVRLRVNFIEIFLIPPKVDSKTDFGWKVGNVILVYCPDSGQMTIPLYLQRWLWFEVGFTYKIITLRSRFHHNIFDTDLTLGLICIWCHCWCDFICFDFCFNFTNWIGRGRFICRLKMTHVTIVTWHLLQCYLLSMWNWNWSLGCLNCWCCSAQCCLRRSRIWNNWIRLDYLLGICLKFLWVGENLLFPSKGEKFLYLEKFQVAPFQKFAKIFERK